ncbi:Protein CBG11671 [Caenorhabditis briggsae]|uniref:Serpentine receptor class r-10 n=2 Tax=Caenorhabditis briggsae TaxID=6238 RepID=A8XDS0_CAEBR|nr:Protein CBG11671 [Caenorhabditis briggsae]CAP30790.1 Protein CBG11671 [Caenorhabditis briggsae]
MGTYRHLMVYFCCCSIVFSIIDLCVQPNIQTYKSAYFMFVDVKKRNLDPFVARIGLNALCGSFGITISGIAVHFVYRFFALERKGRLKYFKGTYMLIWYSIPIFSGISWFLVTWNMSPINSMYTDYIRPTILETFGVHVEDTVYVCGLFHPIDKNGQKYLNYQTIYAFSIYIILMAIPFSIILIFGFKSWKIVTNLLENGESEYSRNLQMQLYKALVAQTILPVSFLFIPFGLIFTLPMFEVNCQLIAYLITLIFATYPALDPLPILYFVDFYRNPIIETFKKLKCKGSQVSPDVERSVIVE